MSKMVFRYFFDFLDGQEKWLNNMADHGYRLKKCGRIFYTFDKCNPGEYEYAVEFIGDKSHSRTQDYRRYLENMGFRTFTKNINLNVSYGKLRWRPYAEGMGQIATSPGGFNRELLILEKNRDGKPFELHTDIQDKLDTCKVVRRTYVWAVLSIWMLIAMTFIPDISSLSTPMISILRIVLVAFSILFIIPTVKYSLLIRQLKEAGQIFE